MDGNAIRRPRETGSRSGAMEDHDSQPSERRRHLIMIMMMMMRVNMYATFGGTHLSNIYFHLGVNRPAIVTEIPHLGSFPAFPHFCQNVPHFWLYFEIAKIAENRNNFSCIKETFCSKKLYEKVTDSVI